MQQLGDPSFEQLLVSARKGDAAAIEVLLGPYRNYLGVLARVRIDRKLQAKFDESDVVQETMIQANRDFHEFRGTTEAALTKWLRTIMCRRQRHLSDPHRQAVESISKTMWRRQQKLEKRD